MRENVSKIEKTWNQQIFGCNRGNPCWFQIGSHQNLPWTTGFRRVTAASTILPSRWWKSWITSRSGKSSVLHFAKTLFSAGSGHAQSRVVRKEDPGISITTIMNSLFALQWWYEGELRPKIRAFLALKNTCRYRRSLHIEDGFFSRMNLGNVQMSQIFSKQYDWNILRWRLASLILKKEKRSFSSLPSSRGTLPSKSVFSVRVTDVEIVQDGNRIWWIIDGLFSRWARSYSTGGKCICIITS